MVDRLIPLHKQIAMGGSYPPPEGNYGVEPLSSVNGSGGGNTSNRILSDSERAAPLHHTNGQMKSQANPEH